MGDNVEENSKCEMAGVKEELNEVRAELCAIKDNVKDICALLRGTTKGRNGCELDSLVTTEYEYDSDDKKNHIRAKTELHYKRFRWAHFFENVFPYITIIIIAGATIIFFKGCGASTSNSVQGESPASSVQASASVQISPAKVKE